MSTFTWGTHNLHDEAGTPTMFADAIGFTEAIPATIRARLARAHLRLTGHVIRVCHQQPDLVFVARRRLFKVTGTSYDRFVDGVPKVTPNRGTFTVYTTYRISGVSIPFVIEHRINAAFEPWVRGERLFRQTAWHKHTRGTLDILARLLTSGYRPCAGGDLNTPPTVQGYGRVIWHEEGHGFDRLASIFRTSDFEVLSRKGSDHPRVRVTVHVPGRAS